MQILIKDGVRYTQVNFHSKENEFEKIVFGQFKYLFGENSLLFPKQKIKTETDIGTIPDGFVLDFENNCWYVIEVEISNHDVYRHIAPQLLKFRSALKNETIKKQLIRNFENEIKSDPFKEAVLISKNHKEIFKTVSELIEKEPQLIIILEDEHKELVNIFSSFPFQTLINVFKVFCSDGVSGDYIYQIQPIIKEKVLIDNKNQKLKQEKIINSENITNRIESEIERVKRKIPKWFKKNNRLNIQILTAFLELSEKNNVVHLKNLETKCSDIKSFHSNYIQMKTIAPNNHAKVFEENEFEEVTLWEPVADFIKTEYEKYLSR